MVITFTSPFLSVGGYFTDLTPLTFQVFDATSVLLGTVGSSFTSNTLLFGDAGRFGSALCCSR
jgi:hypothetical protein